MKLKSNAIESYQCLHVPMVFNYVKNKTLVSYIALGQKCALNPDKMT
jgi:N-dimethylarginine dimethylaminohydrolase